MINGGMSSFFEACMSYLKNFILRLRLISKTKKEMKFKKLLRTINYSVMLYYKNNSSLNDDGFGILKERK
jgi:hypothetical protein